MTVFANAANMSDTHNGVLHISSMFIYLTAIVSGYILWMHGGPNTAMVLGIAFLLLHFVALHYNMFPAKVFNGDVGSLTAGTLVGLVAIMGKVELAIILAMMPWVINGFGNIASLRGFRGRHQLRVRPVIIEGWEIRRSNEKGVPVTLVRLLTSDYSLTEPEVIAAYIILSALAATLSMLVALFTYTI
jgi:UDP-N-acetylglucosamine--dolichyl-phosphate N-acetylglucosaminephosphotransferase